MFAAFCASAVGGRAADAPWWDGKWKCRRYFEVHPVGVGLKGDPVGECHFYHLGQARRDLSDVRVVGEGRVVSHRVMQNGPGDFVRLCFALPKNAPGIHVYYGNPQAESPKDSWEPMRGLWLETRRYRGGAPSDWRAMQRLIKDSHPAYGADFVDQVFHGMNPFRVTESWVSLYRGWLHVTRPGTYQVTTNSDDGSFLFIDGKLVSQYPGSHGPWRNKNPSHFAGVHLDAGLHRFEYYHVNLGGAGVMSALWVPPGGDLQREVQVIPAAAFAPVARARHQLLQDRDEPLALDLGAKCTGQAFYQERPGPALLQYTFADQTRMRSGAPVSSGEVRWDFGDGQTQTGPLVSHVYLDSGLYPVTMKRRLAGKDYTLQCRILVHQDPERQNDPHQAKVQDYLAVIRRYDLTKMDLRSLKRVYELLDSEEYRQAGDEALLERAARCLLEPNRAADAETVFEYGQKLAHLLRGKPEMVGEALRVLQEVEPRLGERMDLKAEIRREIGDLHYYYRHDLEEALQEYNRVLGRYGFKLRSHVTRETKIRIGDIHRELARQVWEKGCHRHREEARRDAAREAARAERNYQEAERLRLEPGPLEQQEVRKGVIIHAAMTYYRRGDWPRAKEWLGIWEWEFPLERLRGPSSYLWACVALGEKSMTEALKHLLTLPRANPRSAEAGKMLYLAAWAYLAKGDLKNCVELLEEIRDEHPDSEYWNRAQKALQMPRDSLALELTETLQMELRLTGSTEETVTDSQQFLRWWKRRWRQGR